MKQLTRKKNAGFTLLELVVVVAVMGMISTMAMEVYTNNSNQQRYDLTDQRLKEIKFAIIGDPMMRVGSQAVLSGFFYDMGRLPRDISELIEINSTHFCLNNDFNESVDADGNPDNNTETSCNTAGFNWINSPENWKGPYLYNLQSSSGSLIFIDAWGGDFELKFNNLSNNLKITSFGLNRSIDGDLDYESDQPKTIYKNELLRINVLKGLSATGYCINTVIATAYVIDSSFIEQTTCDAVTDRSWAAFP